MSRTSLRSLAPVGLAAFLALGAAPAAARDDAKVKDDPSDHQKAAGVIVKVEKLEGRRLRLTINTAAVWRDWVRDQTTGAKDATKKAEVPEGDDSVATKGQPKSPDTLVVVDTTPETKLSLRFRAATDEASEGAAEPGGAAKAADPDAKPGGEPKDQAETLKPDALKDGLFVEVSYARAGDGDRNQARRVVVLKPVGGPDSPPEPAEPK